MKKKKIKKLINELEKKSERELDVEVSLLTDKINSLEEKMRFIDERTMALDNVKVQKALDKTKELDSKIKILMDRTAVDYTKMSAQEITYQECITLLECMKDRGATKEEINGVRKLMNKYIFRCKLLLVDRDDEVPTPEEIIDGKKEA